MSISGSEREKPEEGTDRVRRFLHTTELILNNFGELSNYTDRELIDELFLLQRFGDVLFNRYVVVEKGFRSAFEKWIKEFNTQYPIGSVINVEERNGSWSPEEWLPAKVSGEYKILGIHGVSNFSEKAAFFLVLISTTEAATLFLPISIDELLAASLDVVTKSSE